MSNLKRIILIVGLIIVAVIIGIGLYFMFKKTGMPGITTITPTTTLPGGQLPTSGQRPVTTTAVGAGVITTTLPSAGVVTTTQYPNYYQPKAVTKVSSDYAVYSSLNTTNGDYRYHNALDGKFYRIKSDGTVQELADKVFYNISDVTWADSGNKAILEYPDKSKIIYNFETNTQVTLPQHWEEFSFSPDSKQIAAKSLGLSTENRWLVTFNDDGTGTQTIEPLGNNADLVTVDWSPSKQVVAFSDTGEALGSNRKEILLVGLNGENFKSLTVEGLDFESQWSTTGQKLLYNVDSTRSDYKPELWITDAYGDSIDSNRQSLNLYTWADKCAFADDNTLYCAVPQTLPQGAGMSRSVASGITDDLYKIDLTTGLKTPISLGNNTHTIKDITYNSTQNKLLFTDENQTGVFEVNL